MTPFAASDSGEVVRTSLNRGESYDANDDEEERYSNDDAGGS